MAGLPTGTVTFLFGDVEGSTALLEQLNVPYADEVTTHRRIVGEAVAANGGEIVDQRGDEFFAAFASAAGAVAAAVDIQLRQAEHVMRVRVGLHRWRRWWGQ
jgi:class 3 adenylate cyclase